MRLGKQTLGGYKQNLVCSRTQEKGAVIPQKTDPNLTVSVQESPREVWVSDGLLQGQGCWVRQCVHTFKGGRHYLHYVHHSLVSGQTGKKHSPIYQQRTGLKIYWAWPQPIRTRPSFPHSKSLPKGSFHKPLILIPQRADRMKTSHRKLIKLIS